ncbi:hypothetical protein CS912_02185 (plasmid) [Klebsiella variicola]|nr:hypothetical protein [Klebsiella quasipneumoniae]PIA12102.1 hypothetical protein CS912_02185 [Klebsiella variicola]
MTLQAVNELIASLESAGELSIREQKFLKLAKAYQQLAAENVALKQQEPKAWYIRMTDEVTTDWDEAKMWVGVPLVLAGIETTATDRIVAGIKADGAKAAGDYLKLEAQHMPVVERLMMQDAAEICYGTAARLREGAK